MDKVFPEFEKFKKDWSGVYQEGDGVDGVKGNITFERIDVMNLPELSKGWVWVKLADVADIIMGQSPPSNTYNTGKNGLPFYQGKAEFGDIYPIPVKWCSQPKKIAEKHDILLSVRAPVGPTNICNETSCIGRGLAAIRYKFSDLYKFTFYYLRSIEKDLSSSGTGSTFSAISKSQIENIPIPLPPLAEQKRIVEKIEELFTRLEAGVEALKKVKAQIRRYRQAVLKYAFEGKLTEEWRKHAGANMSVCPENIKKGEHIGSPLQNDLPPLPEGWVWVRLGEVAGEVEMVNPKKNPDKEFLYIDIAAIDNKKQSIVNTKIYSGKNAPSRARQLVKSGDILFSTVKTYLKNIAIVNEAYDGQIASTGFCVIRPKTNINSRFIFWYVQTDDFLNPLNQLQRGTNYPAVRDSDVFEQPLPLPPLPEQRQIVSEIERRFSVADEVEKVVEQSLKQAERLKQSILKKAFEGKLVPQDLNDEPTERLLERIRLKEDKNIKDYKLSGVI